MGGGAPSPAILWMASVSYATRTANNVAEYQGLLVGLRYAARHQRYGLNVVGDSQLILTQLSKRRITRSRHLQGRYEQKCRMLADRLMITSWTHHLRHFNKMADRLANIVMDLKKGIEITAADIPRLPPRWDPVTQALQGDVGHCVEFLSGWIRLRGELGAPRTRHPLSPPNCPAKRRVQFLAVSCTVLLDFAVKPSVVDCSDVVSNSDFLDAGSASVVNNNRVSVFTGHDEPGCSNASTVVIQEGGCDEAQQCTPFMVGAGTTYYGQGICSYSRNAYLQSTFGDVRLFVVEYYEGAYCNKLYRSDEYLADSGCHYFTLGVMKIWAAEDKSMAALTVNSACDAMDWSVFMGLNVSINTGVCIPDIEYDTEAAKYVLLGEPVYFDPFAAKLATNTNKSTTATVATTTTAPTGDAGTSTALSLFTMNTFLTLLLTSVAIAAAN